MGKGSARRNEDTQKVWDNWDIIFGKKEKNTVKTETVEKPTEKDDSEKNK